MIVFTSFGLMLNPWLRFFSNKSAVAGTFAVVSIVVVTIILMTFLCYRRHRKNKQLPVQVQDVRDVRMSRAQMLEDPFADDPFAYSNPRDSAVTIGRQHRLERLPSLSATDEQTMGYAESGSSTHGFNIQRNDVGENILYETKKPPLAGFDPGVVANYFKQNPDDPFSDRHVYQPKPRPVSYWKSLTTTDNLSTATPSQAYLPNLRRTSDTPSSPSVYPTSLTVAEDGKSDRQPPTPTNVAFPKTTAVPSRSYNWGASAKKPSSYGVLVHPEAYMAPPDSADDKGSLATVQQEPPVDGQHQSIPPSIPPKSRLRTATSMRTILNVSSPSDLSFVRTQPDDSIPVTGP